MNLSIKTAFVCFWGVSAAAAFGQVHDLADEFSTLTNPFGQWELLQNPSALHAVVQPDYWQDGSNVRAWANEPWPLPQHVPFWMKVTQPSAQYQLGDVMHHTAEFDRTLTQITMLTWTAPNNCRVYVSGMIWAPTGNNRVNGWQLRTNASNFAQGTLVASGLLVSNGSTMRENAQRFLDSTANDGPIIRHFLAGERVTMLFASLSENGDLGDTLALNMKIQQNPKVLAGTVTLEDYLPNPSQQIGHLTLVDTNTNNDVWDTDFEIKANGSYTVVAPGTLPPGLYRVVIKAPHWLSHSVGVITADPVDVTGLDGTLINGDCDGDNEVGPGDFGQLSAAFGSVPEDANWNDDADLDGDQEVGPSDFGILSANFGEAGN